MKGVSSIIAAILLLLITIVIIGFAFSFFSRVVQQPMSGAQQQLANQEKQYATTFRVDSVNNGTVYIRNTGTMPLTNIAFFVNGILVNASGPSSLPPNELGEYILNSSQLAGMPSSSLLHVSSAGWAVDLNTVILNNTNPGQINFSIPPKYMFSGMSRNFMHSPLFIAYSNDGINFNNVNPSGLSVFSGRGGQGTIDSDIMFYKGQYYVVYGQHNFYNDSAITIANSSDLLHWSDLVQLYNFTNESLLNDFNVPQWLIDNSGVVHIYANVFGNRTAPYGYMSMIGEIHSFSTDPAAWSGRKNWTNITLLTYVDGSYADDDGETYDFYIINSSSTNYVMYHLTGSRWNKNAAANHISGWSKGTDLSTYILVQGEQPSMFLNNDGSMRLYISSYYDNEDPTKIVFFNSIGTNYAQFGLPTNVTMNNFKDVNITWGRFHSLPQGEIK